MEPGWETGRVFRRWPGGLGILGFSQAGVLWGIRVILRLWPGAVRSCVCCVGVFTGRGWGLVEGARGTPAAAAGRGSFSLAGGWRVSGIISGVQEGPGEKGRRESAPAGRCCGSFRTRKQARVKRAWSGESVRCGPCG